jgi:hypothetical protein
MTGGQGFRDAIGIEPKRDRTVILKPGILCRAEGSAFEFSSKYRCFVACRLLRMTVLMGFSAAC